MDRFLCALFSLASLSKQNSDHLMPRKHCNCIITCIRGSTTTTVRRRLADCLSSDLPVRLVFARRNNLLHSSTAQCDTVDDSMHLPLAALVSSRQT